MYGFLNTVNNPSFAGFNYGMNPWTNFGYGCAIPPFMNTIPVNPWTNPWNGAAVHSMHGINGTNGINCCPPIWTGSAFVSAPWTGTVPATWIGMGIPAFGVAPAFNTAGANVNQSAGNWNSAPAANANGSWGANANAGNWGTAPNSGYGHPGTVNPVNGPYSNAA